MTPTAVPLLDLAHAEARRLVATGAPVYLPVNPVEYHGPHLPLHTDSVISRALAARLHERLLQRNKNWPLLVAADLEIGVDPTPGPGTRYTPYRTARALVREACRALVELGAKRVVLMTFHGAPLHNLAVEEGVRILSDNGVAAVAPFNLVVRELLDVDPRDFAGAVAHLDENTREAVLADLRWDFHAGFFETSLVAHLAPASLSSGHRALPPCPSLPPDEALVRASRVAASLGRPTLAAELHFAAVATTWRKLTPFPGYTGRPGDADARAGAYFTERIVERYAEAAQAVFDGTARSPAPIMRWVRTVSLGGRIGELRVPTLEEMARIDVG